MSEELLDWRGTPIKVGSLVVYPTRTGSMMDMREGIVQEISPLIRDGWDNKRHVELKVQPLRSTSTRSNKIVIIRETIRVTVVDNSRAV